MNFNGTLYFLPTRIQKRRLDIMKKCARKKKLKVADDFRPSVTHVITECESKDHALKLLHIESATGCHSVPAIVGSNWFTDSLAVGHLLDCSTYLLESTTKKKDDILKQGDSEIGNGGSKKRYICQQATTLIHRNHRLTDALEVMAEEAELRDGPLDYSRALAFRKAAAALKQLPEQVSALSDIANLHDIGNHSRKIIQDILEDGMSPEVMATQQSEWFSTMKLFCYVYGVGPATAAKWYNLGLRTLEQLQSTPNVNTRRDSRIDYGLAFFDDLNCAVTLEEAKRVADIVRNHFPLDVLIHLVGGFRRGKQSGHDIDLLVSHPTEGHEVGLLRTAFDQLRSNGYILHGGIEKDSFQETHLTKETKMGHHTTIDHFEKAFLIFKLPVGVGQNEQQIKDDGNEDPNFLAQKPRNFVARRVDIVIAPHSQLAYALVGWTGNKQFNRSLRDYSKKELDYRLTSHGLYDTKKRVSLPAQSEEEVFAHLKLPYLKPEERNP